jgi:hypothetical protein
MHSPPVSPPKYGSSCTSGGLFRGRAVGNSLNAADYSNRDNSDYIGPVPGHILLYLSQDDPASVVPESLTPYARLSYDYSPKMPIAPVLEKIARKYSPVRRA